MKRYAVLIGNSQYPPESGFEPLRYPSNDVDDFEAVLKNPTIGDFTEIMPIKNQSHYETHHTIHQCLKKSAHDDLVLIYFSGHGELDDAGELYLAGINTQRDYLASTAISVREIRRLVDTEGVQKAVLILDCCHSGAAGLRGDPVNEQLKTISGEREESGRGIFILTASSSVQTAKEKETDRNGLYTKHLHTGLKSGAPDVHHTGWVTVHDLHKYVHRQVLRERPNQEPHKWGLSETGELILAKSPFKPRQQRAEQLRKRLYELAGQNLIHNNLLQEALVLIRKDDLSEEEQYKDRLLDDLLAENPNYAAFYQAWVHPPSIQTSEEKISLWDRIQPYVTVIGGVAFFIAIIAKQFYDQAEMPDFKNKPLAEVQKFLDDEDWRYEIRTQFNPGVEVNTVLDQEPVAGETLQTDEDKIILWVAKWIEVPDLIGLKQSIAEELIRARGLVVGEIEQVSGSEGSAGTVTKQSISAGRRVRTKTVIGLSVATTSSDVVATAHQHGEVFQDQLQDDSQGPEMVVIDKGCFLMGSLSNEKGRSKDEQQHVVCLEQDYAIGKYEVTFAEYDRFAEATAREKPSNEGWGRGNRPVINVSWQDAVAYADWLSAQTGYHYRLPTEAEWEYAARAGTNTAYWWGDQVSQDYANYGKDECCGEYSEGKDQWLNTAPVGSFEANNWGLHDMHGNVWEWTCSVYDAYSEQRETECAGQENKTRRVVRGGGWLSLPEFLRSSNRNWFSPDDAFDFLGFRLARDL